MSTADPHPSPDRADDPMAVAPPAPPELPPVRADLAHIVIPATVVWFVAFVVLLFFLDDLRAHQAMIWLWTCLAGGLLGLVGLAVYGWQRRAARQGRRSANAMALQERW
ncbi:DUF2530 domain-containing protein [Nakamurella flavida]|uniref:DUF2530 domain-containing protein n=1 Tax=Nakamurella flavida TaxID=363630 RepID=A0A939BZD5_9ACTN|nr:DUF2530 domain-containing protein [Nakamurella flavida]MBM9475618.1 DUF2530 domain-containing protein [Nakamurella flavida]MDP9778106.1 hypothetical protein [Nakamurella flavida]